MNLNFIRLIVGKIKTKIYTFYVQQHIKSCGKGLRVNELSHISGKVRIGNNCHFNGVNIIGDDVIIGNNCHFGHQIQIIATNHNYDYGKTLPYDSTFINKKVVLENNVWVGNNAIILGGGYILVKVQ